MSIVLEISVIPQSKKNAILFDNQGILKIYLKNRAEKGKANKELIEILSNVLHIAQYKFSIVLGSMARKKRIKIDSDLTKEVILERLYKNIRTMENY